ncbi:MAG: hypothetical protein QG671_76 [Actinomycetota bacterium]|nr:hypothetical protein [Actinomycetota bacterium]
MSRTLPEVLTPSVGERGLASGDHDSVGAATLAAWDAFLVGVPNLNPDAPTRAAGSTVRDLLTPLGHWPDSRSLAGILRDAEAGRQWGPADQARAAALVSSHRDAPMAELMASLESARGELADWLTGDDRWPVGQWGLRESASPVGPLPVLTLIHGICYQLATVSLDLQPAGCVVDDNLLLLGLVALVDMMGAFIARTGTTGSLSAVGTQIIVGTGSREHDWRTVVLETSDSRVLGPTVVGATDVLLDVTSGRANAAKLYARGELRVHDLTGMAALLPVLEQVPGIPAVASFGRAATVIARASDMLSRFPFKRG